MPIKLSDLQCFEITLGFMNFFVIYYLCQYTHAETLGNWLNQQNFIRSKLA